MDDIKVPSFSSKWIREAGRVGTRPRFKDMFSKEARTSRVFFVRVSSTSCESAMY